jgi:hypothetical protein
VSHAGNGSTIFKVSTLQPAETQLHGLARRAKILAVGKEFARTLRDVYARLRTAADVWGEPTYDTHLEGGQVRVGVIGGLSLEFVVYREQKVVWLRSIIPLSGHPLAEE